MIENLVLARFNRRNPAKSLRSRTVVRLLVLTVATIKTSETVEKLNPATPSLPALLIFLGPSDRAGAQTRQV
ncbi:MAG: hypothetical protein B7Z55_11365 [Planctomycetales bacterium 12-60-4]|nr:MAG: hypothetical protein B7Z55_11365 [Planctomycetales bacterium 12-60-4]